MYEGGLIPFFPAVFLSGALGFLIFWVIKPRGRSHSPNQVGLKWLAWVEFAGTFLFLPKILYTPISLRNTVEYIAQWLFIGVAMYGIIGFAIGWAIGKFMFRKRTATDIDAAS